MNIYLIISTKELEISKEQKKLLESVGNLKVIYHKGKIGDIIELKTDTEEKVIGIDPDVTDWVLDIEAFDDIKNVKAICTQSTSFSWVKPEILKKKGIAVYNVPGFSADSVAEYIIALAIEGARCLPLHLKNMEVDWATRPMLLKNKKIGIIGLGSIGRRVAELGNGIGMNVIYWSPHSRDERFSYMELIDVIKQADILVPVLKDSSETKGIVTNDLIDQMKTNAVIVGICIGKEKDLFDEKHVISRVEAGKLGGYAFEGKNVTEIKSTANIWGVPPVAWYTKDSLDNLFDGWIKNIVKVVTDA